MLNGMFELLPLFVVRWFARRHCERLPGGRGPAYIIARRDVLFIEDLREKRGETR
jgi:hypothetical protein